MSQNRVCFLHKFDVHFPLNLKCLLRRLHSFVKPFKHIYQILQTGSGCKEATSKKKKDNQQTDDQMMLLKAQKLNQSSFSDNFKSGKRSAWRTKDLSPAVQLNRGLILSLHSYVVAA